MTDDLYEEFKRWYASRQRQQGEAADVTNITNAMVDEYLRVVGVLGSAQAWARADSIKRRLQQEQERKR